MASELAIKHLNTNTMQSETVDFAPGAAIWRSRRNNVVWRPTGVATWRTERRVVFDLADSLHYTKKKTEST